MNTLDFLDNQSLRSDIPDFRPGDTLNVHVKVIEGSKERIQIFKGVVIRRQGGGVRETFTVRKVSFGVGVERTFPVHSPTSRSSRSSLAATFVARSCTTSAICVARPPRSKKSADPVVSTASSSNHAASPNIGDAAWCVGATALMFRTYRY